MPNRIRLALLFLVLVALFAARAGVAQAGVIGNEPHKLRIRDRSKKTKSTADIVDFQI